MIIYSNSDNSNDNKRFLTKERLVKRRKTLRKFNKKVQEQIKINQKRELKSLEYSKNKIYK